MGGAILPIQFCRAAFETRPRGNSTQEGRRRATCVDSLHYRLHISRPDAETDRVLEDKRTGTRSLQSQISQAQQGDVQNRLSALCYLVR